MMPVPVLEDHNFYIVGTVVTCDTKKVPTWYFLLPCWWATCSSSGTKNEDEDHVGGDGRSGGGGGHMLRHFFDDWPRSLQDSDNVENNAAAGRSLSISMPGASSDVSLKLSTGYGEDSGPGNENVSLEPEQLQLNWAGGWASSNQVASMGGPLAEALRSSISTSSPTSVLHHLPRGSGSETSIISTWT